jgi:hypothetical protein
MGLNNPIVHHPPRRVGFFGWQPFKQKRSHPSERDLEILWQELVSRFDEHEHSLPWRWRDFRRMVASVLTAGARGWL